MEDTPVSKSILKQLLGVFDQHNYKNYSVRLKFNKSTPFYNSSPVKSQDNW